jgi:SAM-dependent methyltransferase
MPEPTWPEWGADMPSYLPWHVWTSPTGAHHAGYLLDTVIGPSVETGQSMVYEVLRCEPCIAIHVTPLPDPAALATYYSARFYQEDKPSMLDQYLEDLPWWSQCVYQPLLQQCHDFLWQKNNIRFLDIGAGPCLSLDCGKAFGWHTYGIEPNNMMCQLGMANGHSMFLGTWETVDFPPSVFDIIGLYEVLEHQRCQESLLFYAWELLKPGGILYCVTPNDYSPIQYQAVSTLGCSRYWLAPPMHLFYNTPKMLQLCVRRCGFTIVDLYGTYPLDQALLEGENYISHPALGREVHRRRMMDELVVAEQGRWQERRAEYRWNLAHHRVGREIVVIARKVP